jgi:ubiquitin-like 1-activating enzyme E1 A
MSGSPATTKGTTRSDKNAPQLSAQEAALYDRQIRLWGVDAQRRLRSSKVLVIGVSALAAEVMKNVVLAGVGALHILDDTPPTVTDLCANFLLPEHVIGKKGMKRSTACLERLRNLNQLVDIAALSGSIQNVHLNEYKAVLAFSQSLAVCQDLDAKCRALGVSFFAGIAPGLHGLFFSDCNGHDFIEAIEHNAPDGSKTTEEVRRQQQCPSLQEALRVPWKQPSLKKMAKLLFAWQVLDPFFEDRESNGGAPADWLSASVARLKREEVENTFLPDAYVSSIGQSWRSEFSPVCAIVGGVLGQEVIKIISGKDVPLTNFFFFSGNESTGTVERLP